MSRLYNLSKIALPLVTLLLVTLGAVGSARADVVYLGVNPSGGSGIGAVSTVLSIHNTGFEQGSVGWNGAADFTTGQIAAAGNTQTRSLTEIGVTSSGSQLRVVFNINETGNEGALTSGVALQSLTINIYSSAGAVVGTYNLSAALVNTIYTQSSGIGGAGHVFGLDAAQAANLTALLAGPGGASLRIGISASVGCPAGSAQTDNRCTDDGFETFFAGSVPAAAVPEPASMLLLGTGLIGVAGAARRRFRK